MNGWGRELGRLEGGVEEARQAKPYDPAAHVHALERLVETADREPETAETYRMSELFEELSEAYGAVGRYEDALEAMERAITAGYEGEPDPRCRLAELHLRFGHPEPAHAIFAQVKTETPDDVWLYNNAGLEYRHSGDFERALGWLDDGLELALRTGDPERLVGQLRDVRQGCLDALGRTSDDLQRRATEFEPPARRGAPTWSMAPRSSSVVPQPVPPAERGVKMTVGFAWFPSGDFPLALERWPDWSTAGWSRTSASTAARRSSGC